MSGISVPNGDVSKRSPALRRGGKGTVDELGFQVLYDRLQNGSSVVLHVTSRARVFLLQLGST